MGSPADGDWAARRQRAIAAHAAAQEQVKTAERERARELIAAFVALAQEHGLATTPLVAQAYNGRSRYRTALHGWYLKADRSIAVGADGAFYVLSVPASVRARLRGAHVEPEQPRLVIGEGARDGESMPLADLLRQRLDAGDRWPLT